MNKSIKILQREFPRGAPFCSAALHERGISNDLIQQYVRSGWLERLGRGVFMHAGDTLQREASLVFLESRIEGLHIAAKSALARHGYQHNLSPVAAPIVWGTAQGKLPDWFTERFACRYSGSQLFDTSVESATGLLRLPEAPDGPLVAEPERALLEMLSEVGVHQEVEEARLIMESMRQIRTKRLLYWINACKMVKAVRLCAYLARELGMPWSGKVLGGISDAKLRHRWVARLPDGSTLSLPAMEKGESS